MKLRVKHKNMGDLVLIEMKSKKETVASGI